MKSPCECHVNKNTSHPGRNLGLCSELPHVFSSGGWNCGLPTNPPAVVPAVRTAQAAQPHFPSRINPNITAHLQENTGKSLFLSPCAFHSWTQAGILGCPTGLSILCCQSCLMSARSVVLGWKNCNSHILSKEEWAAPTAFCFSVQVKSKSKLCTACFSEIINVTWNVFIPVMTLLNGGNGNCRWSLQCFRINSFLWGMAFRISGWRSKAG